MYEMELYHREEIDAKDSCYAYGHVASGTMNYAMKMRGKE